MRATRAKYSHKIADTKKVRKREEAETRQKARDTRSDKDQIINLNDGGHTAKKERAKLRAQNG